MNENSNNKEVILKVSGHTVQNALKSAIIGNIMDGKIVYMDCIGSITNYIALKSVIMVRGYLASFGREIEVTQVFHDLILENPHDEIGIKTGIRWILSMHKS